MLGLFAALTCFEGSEIDRMRRSRDHGRIHNNLRAMKASIGQFPLTVVKTHCAGQTMAECFRKDYRTPDYYVQDVELTFKIFSKTTQVSNL
jgi:hypothetical protein